jgi:ribosomal protein L37AE/L43A
MSEKGVNIMSEVRVVGDVARPSACPFCRGKIIDTLAKVLTETTVWRCRECDRTWTIASLRGSSTRVK